MTTSVMPRPAPEALRSLAASTQRDRLLVAMVDAVVDKGYADVTVADVISRAGVSRRTFYEHFRDREACFLAAYDRGVDALASILATAAEPDGKSGGRSEWRTDLRLLLVTYLQTLAAEPGFAQISLIDILAAGPAARARYVAATDRFHQLLRRLDDQATREDRRHARASDTALSILAGGLNRTVLVEVLAGRGANIADFADELYAVALVVLDRRR